MPKLASMFVLSIWIVSSNSHGIAATLYGVTGDQIESKKPVNPEMLFIVSTTDASTTFVQSLGNGDDGESIAFNSHNGLLYHWSGFDNGKIMETVNLNDQSITNIPIDVTTHEPPDVFGSTYDPSSGEFLITDRKWDLIRVSPEGKFSRIGPMKLENRGLAFVGDSLYAGAKEGATLSQLDPTNAATLSTVSVTLSGYNVVGILGLDTDPDTGTLYGIIRTGQINTRVGRRLGTIDPNTGIATDIGPLPKGFANVAFIPEPSTLILVACGFLTFLLHHNPKRRNVTH